MLKAKLAANYFINRARLEKEPLNNRRLNAILCLAQNYCYHKKRRLLFPDEVRELYWGAVVWNVYMRYKPYGTDPIERIDIRYPLDCIVAEDREVLEDAWSKYGKYSGAHLTCVAQEVVSRRNWQSV